MRLSVGEDGFWCLGSTTGKFLHTVVHRQENEMISDDTQICRILTERLVFGVYNFRDKIHPQPVGRKEKLGGGGGDTTTLNPPLYKQKT
jgi:hypothetical protein